MKYYFVAFVIESITKGEDILVRGSFVMSIPHDKTPIDAMDIALEKAEQKRFGNYAGKAIITELHRIE